MADEKSDVDQSLFTSQAQGMEMMSMATEYTGLAQAGNLSDWATALWNGDINSVLEKMENFSDDELKQKLEERQTKLKMTAVFHVILGIRAANNPDPLFQLCMPKVKSRNHKKILDKLISLGANVDSRDLGGNAPLSLTSDLAVAEALLIAGADPNTRNRLGQVPLFMSVQRGELGMVGLLVKFGADQNIKTSGITGVFGLGGLMGISSREMAESKDGKKRREILKILNMKPGLGKDTLENQVCVTAGCGKAAALQCPRCEKLNMEGGFFCSQGCFNGNWSAHKNIHTEVRREKDKHKKVEKILADLCI